MCSLLVSLRCRISWAWLWRLISVPHCEGGRSARWLSASGVLLFHVSASSVPSHNVQYQMEGGRILTPLSTHYVQTKYHLSSGHPYKGYMIALFLQLVEDRISI